MTRANTARHYLAFDRMAAHADRCADDVAATLASLVPGDHQLHAAPQWTPCFPDAALAEPASHGMHFYAVRFDRQPDTRILRAINDGAHRAATGLAAAFADLPIACADVWSPFEASDPLFSTRAAAHRLMRIVPQPLPYGTGANVVIADQGLNADYIQSLGGHFGGGWTSGGTAPGAAPIGHGSMLARNILKVAPDATLLDLPVVPARIDDAGAFLSSVHAAYEHVLHVIDLLRGTADKRWRRPWVFVNAWAVFNAGDEHPKGDYSGGLSHALNQLIARMAAEHDVIFAAGNCGQFCPDQRCGVADVGPGHSILGANAHPDVLTVGAVRADGLWLGYSSQGPGTLCAEKPDVCAASQFREDGDASTGNTGTSAACALAAGVIAAIRSKRDTAGLTPARLRDILCETATGGTGMHDPRLGWGIIDASAAMAHI